MHRLPASGLAAEPLATASSLPPSWYVGEANHALECDTIWRNSWVSVARTEDLCNPGDYVTMQIGAVPIVVVRGQDRVLRAFSNVCPHRSSLLMEGAGNARALQCPYHAWTFSLQGALRAAPGMNEVDSFDPSVVCLPGFSVDMWQGWVFVNPDPDAPPLGAQVAGLTSLVEPYGLESLVRVGQLDFESSVNWKLLVENFAESYHHAAVHPKTLQPDFPGHRSWLRDNQGEPWIWLDHESTNEAIEPFAVVLAFPSHMFSINRGYGMDWLRVEVTSATTIRVQNQLFFTPEHAANEQLVDWFLAAMAEINEEDSKCLARVNAGLASPLAKEGAVHPLEEGCWQFRRWLIDQLRTSPHADESGES